MAAPTLIEVGTNQQGSAATMSVAMPAVVSPGDTILVAVSGTNATNMTAPGFTKVGEGALTFVLAHICDGSEDGTSVVFTAVGTSALVQNGYYVHLSGTHQTMGNLVPTGDVDGANSSTISPSLDLPAVPDEALMIYFCWRNAARTMTAASNGFTVAAPGAVATRATCATKVKSGAGNSGATTTTASGLALSQWGILLAVAPPAAIVNDLRVKMPDGTLVVPNSYRVKNPDNSLVTPSKLLVKHPDNTIEQLWP